MKSTLFIIISLGICAFLFIQMTKIDVKFLKKIHKDKLPDECKYLLTYDSHQHGASQKKLMHLLTKVEINNLRNNDRFLVAFPEYDLVKSYRSKGWLRFKRDTLSTDYVYIYSMHKGLEDELIP